LREAEAVEFVEGAEEASFEVGFVAAELVVGVGSGEVFGDGGAEGDRLLMVGRKRSKIKRGGLAVEVVGHHFGFDAKQPTEAPGGGDDTFGEEKLEVVLRV